MSKCFNCNTYDGKCKAGKNIALQSTKYGSLCPRCINVAAGWLYAKKKGGL